MNVVVGLSRRSARRLVVALAVLAALVLVSGSATPAATPGLVAAYAFDEGSGSSVADLSGNGNNGTVSNTSWVAGKYGGALSFNGSSSRVTVPDSASLHLSSAMTLEAWVDPATTSAAWRDVIYKGNDNYYLEGASDQSGRPAGGGTFGHTYATTALTANTWAHLAVTYDKTTVRLYVNGSQVSSLAATGAIVSSTNPLSIGSDAIYGQYFSGLIDDVRVYNTALTQAQIQTDMTTPVAPPAPDTTPPTAPGTLTASAISSSRVDLSWVAATDNVAVTGYHIERCQGSGCSNFTEIGTATATSYSDTATVVAGTSYSYRVRANDAAGNLGPYSNTATTTTPNPDTTPPTAPGTLTASAISSSRVDLSWVAATDNIGVTGYHIERCQGTGCSNFTEIGTASTTSYSDTSAAAGTSYSYRVRANDAALNLGPYSNTATLTTPIASGPTPVAAYAFDEGSGSSVADLSGNGNNGTVSNTSWVAGKYGGALSFNGSSSRVTVPDSASLHLSSAMTLEAWVDPATTSAAWRDVIYKGNDNYYLEGASDQSGRPAGGGTFGTTYATTALTANTWAHLAVTYDKTTVRLYVNGSQVSSLAATGAIVSSTNPLSIGSDAIYGQYFSGLIDDVRVYNTALTQAQIQTDMTTPVAPPAPDTTPPTAPGTLTASAISSSRVDLSWVAATDNIGVAGYHIERCQGSGCSNFTEIGTATATSYSDTATVVAGTSYSYRVRANDAAGNLGPYSNTATTTTPNPDTTPPTAPGTLTASAISSSRVDLSWVAATDNIGVTGYHIERCQGTGCSNFTEIGTASTTSYSDTSAAAGTSYSYRVRANDAALNLGPYSNTATLTTPIASGPTPVAAYAFDEGSGSSVADLSGNGNNGTVSNTSWVAGKYGGALSFNGSSSRVTVPDSASLHLSSAMTLEAWVDPATTSAAWRDVIYKGNDNYYLEGASDQSGRPAGGGTFGTTYATTALTANTWAHLAVTYDKTTVRLYVNGSQVSSLAATGAIVSSTNPLSIGSDAIYGQYFSGLIDDVRVYNTALTQAQIQTDMTTSVGNLPSAPGTLTATATSSTEVDLAWGAATANLPITGYQVERCQGTGCSNFTQIATPNGTSYDDTGLTPSATYSYRVRAVTSAGAGPYSNAATAFTGLTISPRATDLTFTRTEQFTAQGASGATWSVDGIAGGNASTGTITSAGLYTPPGSVGTHTVTATTLDHSQSVNATVYVTNYGGTFTFHNDNGRTGEDLNEVALTPANVNQATFGKQFGYPLDGLTLASPLYVANVNIPGQGYHNVVYVATEHDSVYAFDADGARSTPLWHDSFIDPAAGITPVPAVDTGETGDIPNEIGITGTPVIDPATGTLYVDATTKEVSGSTTTYYHRLHALDITTGAERAGSPVTIQATVPGTGLGSSGGSLTFVPLRQNQRTGLLLSNGVVYLGFSSRGDVEPFHGWVMGYNATTLQQVMVFCTTPNGDDGGVWMGGDGVAADSAGSLYFITGDGLFDASSGGADYGDSFVKMNTAGTVLDYFTPSVQSTLNTGDIDLGSGGALLLPDQSGAHPHEIVGAGKNSTIYLVDRDNMGHYHSNSNQIVQSIATTWTSGAEEGLFGAPTYFNGNVYFSPFDGTVQAFHLNNGLLTTTPTSQTVETFDGSTLTFPSRGGTLAISANGNTNGILWALESKGDTDPGVLHAYDATNLGTELYNSGQAGSRDQLDPWLKFTVPVVANGRVYVASSGQLTAYGLLP